MIPPPALPMPAMSPLAVPTTFLSKKPVDQTWQGTNVAPKTPMKKRRARRPVALVTSPARAVGTAPASRTPAKQRRGPKRSHRGPMKRRTTRLDYRGVKSKFYAYLEAEEGVNPRCRQSKNVGICNFGLTQMQVFLDGFSHLRDKAN